MDFDLGSVYLLFFFVGLFFAVLSMVFSIFGAGHLGAHHVDIPHDSGGVLNHGDLVGGHQTAGHEMHFSPFAPPVIATFACAFGGTGYATLKVLEQSALISVIASTVVGILVAFLLFLLVSKLLFKSQASSEPRTHELIGTTAEVTVGIPKGGTGEIGYTTMGTRYTAPAISSTGEEIPNHTIVLIQRISSGLFHVEPLRTSVRK